MPEQYSDLECVERIEQEGFEYAVRHYMDSRHIQNPVTGKLWDEAAKAMNKLAEHLHLES